MNRLNNADGLDGLLRAALKPSAAPEPEFNRKIKKAMLESGAAGAAGGAWEVENRGQRRISLWWLPSTAGTLFCLGAAAAAQALLHGPFAAPIATAALISCVGSWLATFVALRLGNLKEAACI